MILKLNRKKILLAFIAIVAVYFVLYNYNQLKDTKTAEGIVVEKYIVTNFDKQQGAQTYLDDSKIYNIIIYPSPTSNTIEATAIHSEENFETGTTIPIRYYENNDKNEIIYTFWSFWFTSIVTSLIIIVVILAFTFSFIDDNEIILLQVGKGGLRLTKNNNKAQTKTDVVKLEG